MKGLIVDDEYFARKGMRLTIPWEKYGIEICEEADCMDQALELLEKMTEIEIVFTDLTMPNGSGFELIDQIRRRYPHIYVVVVTCHRDFNMIQKALRVGAIDYIVKTELEDGVFEESLERIASYTKKDAAKRHNRERGEIYGEVSDEKVYAEFLKKWSDLQWVYDREYYVQLCRKTRKAQLTKALQDQIFREVLGEWNFCIGLEAIPGELEKAFFESESWKEYKGILEELRRIMEKSFSLDKYPKDTVQLVLTIYSYVKENVHQDISQEEIAGKFNISRSYFSRVFKGVFGVNYADYCRNYKIWTAKKLLEETNLPVYQIAEQAGFTDERYFSRIFREIIGRKPSEYRKNAKENGNVSDGV